MVIREMLNHRAFCRVVPLLALVAVAVATSLGCNHGQKQVAKKPPVPGQAAGRPSELLVTRPTVTTLAATFDKLPAPPTKRKPLNALVLSGGGQYAAFNAGLLLGWTSSGQRPSFDAVTGVSSGALV